MVKIGIFGGTRGVGKECIKQALEKGHKVTVMARDINSISEIKSENLQIIQGDVLNDESVDKVVQNQDIVINSLGARVLKGPGIDICSKGTQVILNSMKKNNVNKIITCTSLGVGDSYQYCNAFTRFFIWAIISRAIADKNIQEEIIQKSGLKYIIVRPAGLTDGKCDGKYKVSPTLSGGRISRANVANYIVSQLESDQESWNKCMSLAT